LFEGQIREITSVLKTWLRSDSFEYGWNRKTRKQLSGKDSFLSSFFQTEIRDGSWRRLPHAMLFRTLPATSARTFATRRPSSKLDPAGGRIFDRDFGKGRGQPGKVQGV
jgi:hypothetical protein